MSTDNIFDAIALYDSGEMDAAAAAAFEARLVTDESLQEQLLLYREIKDTLQREPVPAVPEAQLRRTLSELGKEHFTSAVPTAKIFRIKRYLAPAIAAAAVITAVFLWRPWEEDIYHRYMHTQMVTGTERGAAEDSLLREGTAAFNRKDYNRAALLLEKVAAADTSNSFARFYYAISLLETNKVTEAQQLLEALYTGHSIFQYDAAFYMALSYIKTNNKTEAQKWLRYIPQDAVIYEKAQRLLREI